MMYCLTEDEYAELTGGDEDYKKKYDKLVQELEDARRLMTSELRDSPSYGLHDGYVAFMHIKYDSLSDELKDRLGFRRIEQALQQQKRGI